MTSVNTKRKMSIVSYAVALFALFCILKIIALPFKIIIKFIANSIIGGLALLALQFFGIGIAIEWWTVALTGLFGAPGLVIALIITMIL